MSRHSLKSGFFGFLMLLAAVIVVMPTPFLAAAEDGTFSGTWIASGQRWILDFAPDREVFTYRVQGHVNLKTNLGNVSDYWSECTGLWDEQTGSTGRCVWRNPNGDKAFIVLQGRFLEEDIQVSAEVVGGTGNLEGVQGDFTFTWTSVFIDPDTNNLTAHTKNMAGNYRLP